MVAKANSFTPGVFYKLRLKMHCATCAKSYTEYSFMTNLPPEPGSCVVEPPQGKLNIYGSSINVLICKHGYNLISPKHTVKYFTESWKIGWKTS